VKIRIRIEIGSKIRGMLPMPGLACRFVEPAAARVYSFPMLKQGDARPDPIAEFLSRITELRDRWREEDQQKSRDCGDDEFQPGPIWFRGVDSVEHDLKPKIYRPIKNELRKYSRNRADEDEIRRGFKTRAMQLMTETHLPEDEKGWYFLMRHYGAPTRLLDWTDGALLGLYFAVRELTKAREVAVWVLDPSWLNDQTLEDSYLSGVMLPEWKETDPWFPKPFEEVLHVDMPLAIDPPHVARRVTAQRGHFTIHGKVEEALNAMAKEPDSRLIKVTIPAEQIDQIIDDLATYGITETTVFPDLEGLSRELSREFGVE
jgi:hypothetical protein